MNPNATATPSVDNATGPERSSGRTNAAKRVFITGASSGLGLALAQQFRDEGATVVGVARDAIRLASTLEPIGAKFFAADVGSDDAEGIAVRATSLAGGPFDVVIHAASTLGPLSEDPEDPMPRLQTLLPTALAHVFSVNALGPAHLIRALHRGMRREGGTIVVVTSDAATNAYPGWGAYGAAKLALDHLVRVWAEEEPALNFLSFDPGEMDTPMHAAALPGADVTALQSPDVVATRLLATLSEQSQPAPALR